MKLPTFRRIFKTDFEQQSQPLIDKLAGVLNNSIEVLYEALNKKVSLRENILCSVRDVDLSVDTDGNPTVIASMSLDVANARVEGLTVIRVDNLTNSAIYPSGQPFITFTQQGDAVLFNNIKGLLPNYRWRLRVIAWQA